MVILSDDEWKSIDNQLSELYQSRLEREIEGYLRPEKGEMNARDTILSFLLFSMRYIKSMPRQLEISEELKKKIPTFDPDVQKEIGILINNIKSGIGNLNLRLPKVVHYRDNPDPLLYNWGIRRLYLGVYTKKFTPRLELIALVIVADSYALLIDIASPTQVDLKSILYVKQLVTICCKNWPHLIGSYPKSPGTSSLKMLENDLAKPVEIESGIILYPLESIKDCNIRSDEMISHIRREIEIIRETVPGISISDIKIKDKSDAIILKYTSNKDKKFKYLFDLSGNKIEDIEGRFMNFDRMRGIIEKQFTGEIAKELGNHMLDTMIKEEEMALLQGVKPYVIAMVDVLGFKGILDDYAEKLDELGRIYRDLQFQANKQLLNEGVYVKGDKSGFIAYPIPHVFFSDTILMWEEIHHDEPEKATKINRFLNSFQLLMHNALVSEKIPLRAGIAYGDCILALDANLFIGEPIAWAHIVESNQEWVGAAFHPSFIDLIDSFTAVERLQANQDTYIVHYPEMPLKRNKEGNIVLEEKDRPSYAFSILGGQNILDTIELLKKSAIEKNPKELKDILNKYDNTMKFLKFTNKK